jgi:hypothetical protein
MILCHHVVQRLHLVDFDHGAVCLMVAFDRRFIGLAPIDGHLLGDPVAADRWRENAERRLGIPVLREQHVNGLPGRIDGALEIAPLLFDPNVRFVQAPAAPHRALTAVAGLFQEGAVLQDPALDGRVVDGHPTLLHEFFHLMVAQGIGQIPPHARQDNVSHKVGALEADHDRSLARVVSRRIEGADYSRNYEPRKFATEPFTRLKSGGRQNRNEVQAVIFKSGTPFPPNGKPFTAVTFKQG